MSWLFLYAWQIARGAWRRLNEAWVVVVCALVLLASNCTREARPIVSLGGAFGSPLRFRFPLPSGTSVSNEELAGRLTVILFLTTYDTASQAVARRLDELAHAHTPRINVLAVALEPPQNAPLIAVYRDALSLGYEVALADQDTLDGRGPFGDVRVVPAMVLLDRQSRIMRQGSGVEALSDIESALARADASGH